MGVGQVLGRDLTPVERVHHRDEDPSNNHPSNLFRCDSTSDHARLHAQAYQYLVEIQQTEQFLKWYRQEYPSKEIK